MLIDMHVHSSGISKCCKIPYDEAIRRARDAGIDAIVLTNHYFDGYVTDGDYAAFAKRYVEEYYAAKAYGDSIGYPVFFGIELSYNAMQDAHIPIYGVAPEFLLEHPTLFDYAPEMLYALVHEQGGIVVQAHPLRRGETVRDLQYLDGIEMNCHPKYEGPLYETLAPVASDGGKFVTCGSDYHGDVPFRPVCGVQCPEGIDSVEKLVTFLTSAKTINLHLSEVDGVHREEVFERT